MTPLHWQILLHYHCVAEPYAKNDPAHAGSYAVTEYTDQLVSWHLIKRGEGSSALYHSTERGRCLVNFICNLSLPVHAWRMPIQLEEEKV